MGRGRLGGGFGKDDPVQAAGGHLGRKAEVGGRVCRNLCGWDAGCVGGSPCTAASPDSPPTAADFEIDLLSNSAGWAAARWISAQPRRLRGEGQLVCCRYAALDSRQGPRGRASSPRPAGRSNGHFRCCCCMVLLMLVAGCAPAPSAAHAAAVCSSVPAPSWLALSPPAIDCAQPPEP